jgi:hypothetical protein
MKHPREHEDYEVEVRKGDDVVVIFKPTDRQPASAFADPSQRLAGCGMVDYTF